MIEQNLNQNNQESEVKNPHFEDDFEVSIRPRKFIDYVGQQKIKDNIEISIKAAKNRNETIEHILFYGPPGLGKTTLAHIIANELGAGIKITSGPAIERAGDLASILTNLEEGDILFIDEIHRLNRNIEEVLYPAMEDYAIDLVLGKGPSARTMRLDIPRFTLIGATTKYGALSSPFRDRFSAHYRLEFYENDEITLILDRTSKILHFKIGHESIKEIAKRSRKTPRIANRLLKRVRDYAEVVHSGKIDPNIARDSLTKLDIDHIGLDLSDVLYLKTVIEKYKGGPVGLDTIAASMSEDKDTVEDVIEPYLLQLGFIDRTKKGRVATDKAFTHLGCQKINSSQKLL